MQALNIHTADEFSLKGPVGQVYAMAVASDMLFTGAQVISLISVHLCLNHSFVCIILFCGQKPVTQFVGLLQNGVIIAWKGSCEANSFQVAASLEGHTGAVLCLTVGEKMLFSGSVDQTIRVSSSPMSGVFLIKYVM